jgi:hypothetical protein
MTIDQRVDKLKQARKLVAEAVAGCGIPQLESMLREVDMNLHWALWNLGEVGDLTPDLEIQAGR